MGDLISKSALLESLIHCEDLKGRRAVEAVAKLINEAPEVDAVPVVHAEWVGIEYDTLFKCSKCGYLTDYMLTDFCPDCGAKMDGGKAE